ncbi:MAG: hypothetical protein QOK40_3481, partial [Miltoncostaeaceae bacterium]|nr:hypothetical protein [Miltoncostaeaceae bacterium]
MQIRVLVAEDHPLVREGVIKPDVMVLDLRMPGLGGAVVLERLR